MDILLCNVHRITLLSSVVYIVYVVYSVLQTSQFHKRMFKDAPLQISLSTLVFSSLSLSNVSFCLSKRHSAVFCSGVPHCPLQSLKGDNSWPDSTGSILHTITA